MPSEPQPTKIAIAGITGKLGRLVAEELLKRPNVIEVHGIAREPEKLPIDLKSNEKLKLFQADLTSASSIREGVRGCSILISVVLADPFTEVAMNKAMVDACVEEGVPRLMPNEFTLDWRGVDMDLLPQKKGNQELYEYLAEREDKIKSVHLLIGGFTETMFSAGFWFPPNQSPADGLSTWGTGDEIWEMTSYKNAAQCAAVVALDPQATGFFRYLGDRLSVKEIAKTLEETYNLPPIPFTSRGRLADLKKIVQDGIAAEKEAYASGTASKEFNFWAWMGQSYTLFLANGQAYLETPLDNGKVLDSVQQETLEDWLKGRRLEDLSKSVLTV